MTITMKSNPIKVTKIRKTKALFWEDVQVGDTLVFSQNVEPQGHGRGLYAVDVRIENATQGKAIRNSMNQATNNMRGFEFEEVDEK